MKKENEPILPPDKAENNTQNNAESGTDEIKYQVFYGDSEEVARALAVAHIIEKANEKTVDVERPEIPFSRVFTGLILPLLLNAGAIALFIVFNDAIPVWAFVSVCVLIFLLFIKHFVILFVLAYQKFAPADLRTACRFEPTCSDYMLLAIEKYGFLRGFFKGIKRLLRCHYPNGGIDYP